MAKIIITMMPEMSSFNATLTLAHELRNRNHNIIYTGPYQYKEHIEEQGFSYFSYNEKINEEGNNPVVVSIAQKKMDELIESFRPDLALIDPNFFSYSISFYRYQVPMIGLCHTLAYRFRTTTPPIFSGKVPENPCSVKNKMVNLIMWVLTVKRNFTHWQTHPIIGILKYFKYIKKSFTQNELINLNNSLKAIREIKKLGGQIVYGEYGPRLKLPELVLAPAEIDTPWNVSFDKRIYAGACVHQERNDPLFGGNFMLKSNKPLVYCSLGTYNISYPHANRLLNAVFDSFSTKPQYNLILHGGQVLSADSIENRPKNIYISQFAPQLKILKRARCFITHGGFSSVREACFYGVPMIVFPNWMDQPGNSARIVYHNIGVRGDIKSVTKNDIDNFVEIVLKNKSIEVSMKKMSLAFKQQTNCCEGIRFIEKYLENLNHEIVEISI